MANHDSIDVEGFDKGVFSVIVLGIIFDPQNKKILIGKRHSDPDIPQLSWAFPGGRPEYTEEVDDAVVREVKEETGLDVENLGAIFSKTYPEKRNFLAIYYLCEKTGGKETPGDNFTELKWVNSEELEKYFTTSFHPKLKEYIMNLK